MYPLSKGRAMGGGMREVDTKLISRSRIFGVLPGVSAPKNCRKVVCDVDVS